MATCGMKLRNVAQFLSSKSCITSRIRLLSVSARNQSTQSPVGFIGLGNMGNHMANNLIKKGYPVIAYDISKECLETLSQAGGKVGGSPAEVASQADRIITMLPASQHVLKVYMGDDGILNSIQKGSLLVDSSTIDPAVSKQVAEEAAKKGATFCDAPVSGGVLAARDAMLTFMVGASDEGFTRANEILTHLGKNVVHCGAVGTGEAAKICNNMLLGISMIGTSEAMNLGTRLGLDPKMLAKIMNMSTGRCWASDTYNPCPGVIEGVPSSNNYQGGFGTALMCKDLSLSQNAALSEKIPTPMGSLAHQMYRMMTNGGYAKLDFSSAFKYLQEIEKQE